MFAGAFWLALQVRQIPFAERGERGRPLFPRMSIGVGSAFIVWAGLVIVSDIVRIAFPLTIGGVGLFLVLQGVVLNRLKL